MKIVGIILLMAAVTGFGFKSNLYSDSADCDTYFPLTVGMKWTMEHKDKKGKLTGSNSIEVLDTKPTDGGIIYAMHGTFSAEGKENETHETDFEYECTNGTLKFNMDQFVPSEMLNNESMTFSMDTDGMELPGSLSEGQKLKDATIHIIGKVEAMKVIDMTVTVSDRIVEKFEEVTTKAGTFKCAKITSKTNIKMGFMNQTTSSIEWISKEAGIVKTEEYDKKGKFSGSSELTEFKR